MSVKVITVGREFGSGGRSVGKAVAAALGWDYYDQELVRHVAEKTGFAERYIEETGEYSASKSRLACSGVRIILDFTLALGIPGIILTKSITNSELEWVMTARLE